VEVLDDLPEIELKFLGNLPAYKAEVEETMV
jgi:hypothetical protein